MFSRLLLLQMLANSLPFDEAALLEANREYLLRSLGLQQLGVSVVEYDPTAKQEERSVPGEPGVELSTE